MSVTRTVSLSMKCNCRCCSCRFGDCDDCVVGSPQAEEAAYRDDDEYDDNECLVAILLVIVNVEARGLDIVDADVDANAA